MAEWGIAMSNFHPMRPGAPSEAEMERDAGAFVALAQLAQQRHMPPGFAAQREASALLEDSHELAPTTRESINTRSKSRISRRWPKSGCAAPGATMRDGPTLGSRRWRWTG
jgi:hypothetical protein